MDRLTQRVFPLLFGITLSLHAKVDPWQIDIPYQKFVLDNGLTLIVHEDHKAPIVAVNVWYHVGSKDERPGKTGFAHLFEHLMFNGSEHYDDDYFQIMESIGATDLNGTTWFDRTNYFQNVPSSALDIALWLESDRMGHLLGAVTQEKLDEQRGVVKNEKRQYENQPYAIAEELIQSACFPKGHPYSWTTIGSMEDLDAASLEDVYSWFKTHYGASNAVICLAGDITPEVALEKVKTYFGSIPPGPPIVKKKAWIAKRTGTHREIAQDQVPQARLYRVWNIPPWGSREGDLLTLVGDVLASGKTSRLYKRLVYDEQIATDVRIDVQLFEIAGLFQIEATAKPGVDLTRIEASVQDELEKFLRTGPTQKELQRVKTQYLADFIRGIERIGGFGGKSDILASNQVYGGTPDYYKTTLAHIKTASRDDLLKVARAWLSDGDYVLQIVPYPDYASSENVVDRSRLPEPGTPPDARFPEIHRATLANGLQVILAERHTVPLVQCHLFIDAGYAADQFAVPGTARLTLEMLDEGTKTRSSLAISEALAQIGASLSTGSNLDVSYVTLNTLKSTLDAALDLYADVILNPVFPQADFERLKKQTIARIQREKVTPVQMALRVYAGILYGKDHAYGLPLTGSGTETSVASLTRDDLIRFHQTWFKPNHATLVVVGDITMAELLPKLEKRFKAWTPGEVPMKHIGLVSHKPSQELYLLDRPGSQQTILFAGHIAPPRANPDEEAMTLFVNILGGDFTSRINMNLREEKHWTYGARSFLLDARGQRPFITYTSVQSDKTKEAIEEISREFQEVLSGRPVREEEFQKVQRNEILRLPGSWETIGDIAASLADLVRFGLPDDYFSRYPEIIRTLTKEDVNRAAHTLLHPDRVVWVVVGDRAHIEPALRTLGLPIRLMDADGRLLD